MIRLRNEFSGEPALPSRLPFLDAVRGCLAVVVVADHVAEQFNVLWIETPASVAVLIFFVMSGFVLARAYDGRPGVFLLKRQARLWPLYAACLLFGYVAIAHRPPPAGAFVWWPLVLPEINRPAWSLYCEAWASPGLLLAFRIARLSRAAILAVTAASFALPLVDARLFVVPFFLIGVAASRFEFRLPEHVPNWALWLGQISYSLYLTHFLILQLAVRAGGPWAGAVSVLVMLPVAWIAWRLVERPSIQLSRWLASNKSLVGRSVQHA